MVDALIGQEEGVLTPEPDTDAPEDTAWETGKW